MSLLRASIRNLSSLRRTNVSSISTQCRYASGAARTDRTAADGASDKTQETAQPKILNRNPPKDGDAPEDVKKHNEEMAQRADKPSMSASDKDVENDKVGKGFWGGKEAEGQKGVKGTQGGSS